MILFNKSYGVMVFNGLNELGISCVTGVIYMYIRGHVYIYIYMFVKLIFQMSIVRRQHHCFSINKQIFLRECWSSWDRKCFQAERNWTPHHWVHAECSAIINIYIYVYIYINLSIKVSLFHNLMARLCNLGIDLKIIPPSSKIVNLPKGPFHNVMMWYIN